MDPLRDPVPFQPTAPFWAAAERGALALPLCVACGESRWYPLPACSSCDDLGEPRWVDLGGRASLETWTRVHRTFIPELPTPYLVGLFVPDEVPSARVVAGIECAGDPAIGRAFRVRFRAQGSLRVPYFVPEEDACR